MQTQKKEYYSSRNQTALKGLTQREVEKSRKQHGENRLTSKKRAGFWSSFAHSFGDPMIKILLVALAVNIIFLSQNANWFETAGIAFAILLATLVSTISEYGSESAFEKLQEEASQIRCRVLRAKGPKEIPIEEIVVGDLVSLQPGDRIPADGYLVQGQLEVDQSALNGESKEAKKRAIDKPAQQAASDNFLDAHTLFSSSVVSTGDGVMCVASVGDATFYGRIGAEIQVETRESPLRHRLTGLAESIGKFGYIAAVFSALAYLFNNIVIDNAFQMDLIKASLTSWHTMFPLFMQACTLGISVIVMAVPEGLPMMITVVLSANMKRMLKDNVLVRKLIGIETAGSMNILFTDKTGTLTSGNLSVTEFVDATGTIWDKRNLHKKAPALQGILKNSIAYNNSAVMEGKKAIGGNATDRALLEFAHAMDGGNQGLKSQVTLPFTSQNKLMTSAVSGSWNVTLIKGAPEKILPYCTAYYDASGKERFSTNKLQLERVLKDYTKKSMRVIAVATAEYSIDNPRAIKKLKLVGLLAIRDTIRSKTHHGIQQVMQAGIQTVMITGDAKETAAAIATELKILHSPNHMVITHDELSRMSDQHLSEILPRIRVVARALPSDKSRLVRVAQANGLVVGMTGDGVNDAPALKQADVGFAMGSGTEVAKEAGDIVILDNRFDSIAKAVCYGRTIFNSIRKFVIYQMSTCLCAVGVTVIGPLIKVDFPITVIQMLWINIVMDTLAGLAFSGEKARTEYMRESPKPRDEPIINGYMKNQIAISSLYTITLFLCFLKSSYFSGLIQIYGLTYGMTAFFELFMFCAIFNSFNARTSRMNLFTHLSANKSFISLMGLVAVIQAIIPFVGGEVFRTVPLYAKDMIILLVIAFSVIPVDLLRKRFTRSIHVFPSVKPAVPSIQKHTAA